MAEPRSQKGTIVPIHLPKDLAQSLVRSILHLQHNNRFRVEGSRARSNVALAESTAISEEALTWLYTKINGVETYGETDKKRLSFDVRDLRDT